MYRNRGEGGGAVILIVGGLASGKRTYARSLGYTDADMACAVVDERPVVFDAQELVREGEANETLIAALAAKQVVMCTDVGGGIVPLDPGERAWRERAGRMAARLAELAECVVRMVCGIPVVLKGEPEAAAQATTPHRTKREETYLDLVLMRHGQTPGNAERRYVGVIDQSLSDLGREQARAAGICPNIERVYVTSLARTQETAAICFPNAEQIIVDGLQEMDFGVFAGRTADEMVDDADYRAWVDGMCEGVCPGGESRAQATSRICRALGRLIARAQQAGEARLVVVAHGGTMMSALSSYCIDTPKRDYYEWLTGNCKGWRVKARLTQGGTLILRDAESFEDLGFLGM